MPNKSDIFAQKAMSQKNPRTNKLQSKSQGEIHRFTCRQCGSAMAYSIGEKSIGCNACGHSETITTIAGKTVSEYSLQEALKAFKLKPMNAPETDVRCKTCGATSKWDAHRLSDTCPYCQTPMAKLDNENNRFQIEAIIPFSVEKQQTYKNLSKWLKSRWFAPNVLKEIGGHSKTFKGVYMPHWTFDSLTYTDYSGQRGEQYIDFVEQKIIENGKWVTRQVPVPKTRWYPASGRVRLMFDDVLVLASMLIPKTIVNQLRPWQLDQAEPYTPEYLAGLEANYYQIDLDEAFQIAQQRMSGEINYAIRRDIGGDLQSIHSKNTQYQNSTYKLLMLPVWYSAFEYKDKMYSVIINGQTGKVVGDYPKSFIKIAAAAFIGVLIFLSIAGYFYAK